MIKNMKNPASTLSNIFYVIFGILALSETPVMGTLLIGLGIASAGFHWKRTDCWHKADIVMIYYVFAVIGMWLWIGSTLGVMLGITLGMVAHCSFKDYSRYSQPIIGVLGLIVVIPYTLENGWAEMLHMLKWFAFAMLFGRLAVYFNPEEDSMQYDSLHSAWHLWSSVGIYYLIT